MNGPRRAVLSLAEAVATVGDRDTVYIGNFGAQLFAVADELVTQRRRHLHLVAGSGGLLLDGLIGAGVVDRATVAHCWSPVGPHPARHFQRAVQSGELALHELSLGMLTAALTAAAWGVPFMPVPSPTGTGYLTEDWTGGMLAAAHTRFGHAHVVRALRPDVAFVHADLADQHGNATIRTPLGETAAAAQAATRVVVVAEELAGPQRVREAGITLPGLLVSTVVVQPGAVRPDGVPGRYPRDVEGYRVRAAGLPAADEGADR